MGEDHLVEEDQLVRLDVPLDAYRKKLTASSHDSADWLTALSEAGPDGAGTAPGTGIKT